MKLPKAKAILEGTNLRFLDLNSLIAHSKETGYLEIIYPEGQDVIFLKEGRILGGGRISRNDRLSFNVDRIIERAKNRDGVVNFYQIPLEILVMYLGSFIHSPTYKNLNSEFINLRNLLALLIRSKFTGYLEMQMEEALNYLRFERGQVVERYFCDEIKFNPEAPLLTQIINLVEGGQQVATFNVYDTLQQVCREATLEETILMLDVINKVSRSITSLLGPRLGLSYLEEALQEARKEYSFMNEFVINQNGSVSGRATVNVTSLADGFAKWLSLLIDKCFRLVGKEIERLAEEALEGFSDDLRVMGFLKTFSLKRGFK